MNTVKTIPNELFFATVEEVISEGRSVEMTVKGFSMRPFFRNGRDVVVLSPVEGALREGMVVLFRHKGAHILHRLRKIEGQRLTIEGDGNYRQREEAQMGDVVAYVSEVRPNNRAGFRYGSFGWRFRSFISLGVKRLRTAAIDVKRMIKR